MLSDCTVALQPKSRSVGFTPRRSGRGHGGDINASPADLRSGSLNREVGRGLSGQGIVRHEMSRRM
jgi:hypothetical protein